MKERLRLLAGRDRAIIIFSLAIVPFLLILDYAFKYHLEKYATYLLVFYLIASVAFRLDCRVSVGIAIVLLTAAPFFIIGRKEPYADLLSGYAFYFLSFGILQQLMVHLRFKK